MAVKKKVEEKKAYTPPPPPEKKGLTQGGTGGMEGFDWLFGNLRSKLEPYWEEFSPISTPADLQAYWMQKATQRQLPRAETEAIFKNIPTSPLASQQAEAALASLVGGGTTPDDPFGGEDSGEIGTFVRTEILNGRVVPIYKRKDGTEYYNFAEAWDEFETPGQRDVREREIAQRQLEQQNNIAYQNMQFQREQMAWEQQQAEATREAQRQERLAQLRANPASWLEYAALAKEAPVVQPWMIPLMPRQYNIGERLPGWTEDMPLNSLQELTTPSTQYQARIAPSSVQQYYGYEKARTGARPEDTQWRLWNTAPPSGMNKQVTWQR